MILNFWLIPTYSYIGAGISTFIAELTVLVIQLISGYKYIYFKLFERTLWNYLGATFIMGMVVYTTTLYIVDSWNIIITSILIGGFIYITLLYSLKDSLILNLISISKYNITKLWNKVKF